MFRLIIIALVSFSSAAFAAEPGGGKARLKKMLDCEAALVNQLSPRHQDLLARLQNLAEKYEIITMTVPDFAETNMGISIVTFYAELNSLAGQILETRQPRDAAELDLILSQIETQMSLALQPKTFKPDPRIPNKARMETRAFDEDWNTMYPAPQLPAQEPVPNWGMGNDMPMPVGPHDLNPPPRAQQQRLRQQEQPRMQRVVAPIPDKRRMETRGFEPDWEQPLTPNERAEMQLPPAQAKPTLKPSELWNPDQHLFGDDSTGHWNWPPRAKP